MRPIAWSYSDFAAGLQETGESLKAEGAVVDFTRVETGGASVRLRVERGKRLGELTAWEEGDAHLVVLDLESEDVVLERDGVRWATGSKEPLLEEFFEHVGGRRR